MVDVYLWPVPSDPNRNDVRLRDPTTGAGSISAGAGSVSFAFNVNGVGSTAGGVVEGVGAASIAFDVAGVGERVGGVKGGGGPLIGRAKPVLRVWWREAVDEAREEIAELVDEAAEIESAKQRKRIDALLAELNAEVLALEAATDEARAAIIATSLARQTERVEAAIEAILAAQEDEEEVELLLLT